MKRSVFACVLALAMGSSVGGEGLDPGSAPLQSVPVAEGAGGA